MIIHLSAFTLILILIAGAIHYRSRLLPLITPYIPMRVRARFTNYTPLHSFSFADQIGAGMSSRNFDVEEQNGEGSGDSRLGLDEEGVEEVRRIMAVEKCNFDQARLIRHNRHLAKNGIAPDGTPLDRKAITRLS